MTIDILESSKFLENFIKNTITKMNHSNKKRKYVPSEWSWTSKLYNASSLAKTATDCSAQIEVLNEQLYHAEQMKLSKSEECLDLKSTLNILEKRYKICDTAFHESKELSMSLIEENRSLKASNTAKQSEFDVLQKELSDEKTNFCELDSIKNKRIISLEKELHNAKRECGENRARKKMWKKKYEELAQMGAAALAKITNDSYGVSPSRFEAYKKIVDTQVEVNKAEQERSEAIKLLHANVNALEDKH